MSLPRPLLAVIAVGLGSLAGLAAAEVLARAAGHEPWTPITNLDDWPFVAMREPDPVLGWRNKPGEYTSPPYVPGGQGHTAHILADGSRATSLQPPATGPRVALIGGSFIFGQGISDDETLAWGLQLADPARRYGNYGVSAFGAYQSLLLLERLFAGGDPPASVLYGFIDHHKIRNVGRSQWLRHLSRFSRGGEVTLPYCSLDEHGELVRHPPERYPHWPLRRYLAFVNLLGDTVRHRLHDPRFQQRGRITELLLLEMYKLCQAHGAEFLVGLIGNEPRNPTPDTEFLAAHQVPFADCRFVHTPELRVPGEGHPNGLANQQWLACIQPAFAPAAPNPP